MSVRGTHHGCYRPGQDGRVGEGSEGVLVLVGVLVRVLVLMLMVLGAQVAARCHGCSSIGALGGEEAGVQLLTQEVLLCKRVGEGVSDSFLSNLKRCDVSIRIMNAQPQRPLLFKLDVESWIKRELRYESCLT